MFSSSNSDTNDTNNNLKIVCSYEFIILLLDYGIWYLNIEYMKTQEWKCTKISDLFIDIKDYILSYKMQYKAKDKIQFLNYYETMDFFKSGFETIQLILLLILCYNYTKELNDAIIIWLEIRRRQLQKLFDINLFHYKINYHIKEYVNKLKFNNGIKYKYNEYNINVRQKNISLKSILKKHSILNKIKYNNNDNNKETNIKKNVHWDLNLYKYGGRGKTEFTICPALKSHTKIRLTQNEVEEHIALKKRQSKSNHYSIKSNNKSINISKNNNKSIIKISKNKQIISNYDPIIANKITMQRIKNENTHLSRGARMVLMISKKNKEKKVLNQKNNFINKQKISQPKELNKLNEEFNDLSIKYNNLKKKNIVTIIE